ncbi:family 20 glycosylhydrolase [Capnocytophaga canimorsus]|uniref:glycoside hydrolase family 20 protein n=1 Tax=Capnocytophaga canimorsus TaxID=28188 RepID=UPI003858C8F6
MKVGIIFLSLLWALQSCTSVEKEIISADTNVSIIPQVANIELGSTFFEFDANTKFVANDENQQKAISLLNEKFQKAAGWQLQRSATANNSTENVVVFTQNSNHQAEAYTLEISEKRIEIQSNDYRGYVHAIQTLRLLLPQNIESEQKQQTAWRVPTLKITDQPRFLWRGLMLDVARHFFDKAYILKTIDVMAMLKLNVLHLHLVDDQGWRLEIKKYPKLTEIGAWRVDQEDKHWDARSKNNPSEQGTYGGFYTQEDIRQIVAYAHKRGIEVMPEIEMPAHVTSAIAAYPKLSCHKQPVAVPSGGVWPITDIYCAGQEQTFTFLEEVLTEVMELFPFEYIHIGGDEATKTEWKRCKDCQRRIKDHKLKDEHELQSYFIKRIDTFLSSKGKKLVGWDEIIEGGLPKNATVMSWRGFDGGIKASELGNDVIMTPGDFCYLDQYQGDPEKEPLTIGGNIPLSKVYTFDPILEEMTSEQKQHILGGQGNLWSEYVTAPAESQYMIFPRILALSEALWSPNSVKNWENFVKRTEALFHRLDVMGINYAKSMYQVQIRENITEAGKVEITLQSEYPDADIRYAIADGNYQKYTSPFQINQSEKIRAVVFKNEAPFGAVSQKEIRFHKAVGKKVSFENPYHKNYQGQQEATLTNIVRGSKNFHDKQWLAWLVDDASFVVDLEESILIENVLLGVMENQGQGIYYPTQVAVSLSQDGKKYTPVGTFNRAFEKNGYAVITDFEIKFAPQKARFVKIKVTNLGNPPKGGDAWLFIDEVSIQ